MATECTQEAVLEFLIEKGGRVKNKELMDHFKVFLTSETTKRTLFSESFKRFVDNISYIKQENEDIMVCLKKKYLDQGETREKTDDGKTTLHENSGPLHFNARTLNGAINDQSKGTYPDFRENGVDRGLFNYNQGMQSVGNENILGSNENKYSSQISNTPSAYRIPETVCYEKRMCVSKSKIAESELRTSDIELIEATSSDSSYSFPHNLKEKDPVNATENNTKADEVELVETEETFPSADHATAKGTAQLVARRRGSRGPSRMASLSEDNPSGGLGTDSSGPRGGRRSLAESPQVRRSLVRRSCHGCATAGKQDSLRSDGDSDDSASITLDPLEHEWMMCASDGEWENLQRLLAHEPSLITKKDFVTGFTCLHWAAKQGKHELIAMLITFALQHSVTVDVNIGSGAGYTPLHLAAMHSHIEVMRLLVEVYGANLEARDYSGRKPCQYLSATVAGDIQDIIRTHEDEDTEDAGSTVGHWRLPKVFQSNLNPLRLLILTEEGESVGGAKPRPLYRKSSIGKIKLKGGRAKTQIVHSTSFRESEEAEDPLKTPVKSRPVSDLFG